MTELVEHALGVHLNQRHEDYLLDHGLGYSAIKECYLNAVEWWDGSVHNPLRDAPSEEAQVTYKLAFLRGAALHTFVLEGQKLYEKVYGVRPSKSTHPEALDTVKELAEACQRFGLDHRGLKGELIWRLTEARSRLLKSPRRRKKLDAALPPVDPAILDIEILADLQEQFDRSGRRHIAPKDDRRIRILNHMMMRSAGEWKLDGDAITIRDALAGGLSEVSVYWVDENGIRQRARFDRLKVNLSVDLKSITRWKKSNFREELLKEVILRGYMIQAAHYHEARKELRRAVAEGRVFGGNKTQRRLLERIAQSDHWAWFFIFAKMDGAAQVKGILIHPDSDAQFERAVKQREEALSNFLFHREFHGGIDVPWFDPEVVFEPQPDDWPLFTVLGQ